MSNFEVGQLVRVKNVPSMFNYQTGLGTYIGEGEAYASYAKGYLLYKPLQKEAGYNAEKQIVPAEAMEVAHKFKVGDRVVVGANEVAAENGFGQIIQLEMPGTARPNEPYYYYQMADGLRQTVYESALTAATTPAFAIGDVVRVECRSHGSHKGRVTAINSSGRYDVELLDKAYEGEMFRNEPTERLSLWIEEKVSTPTRKFQVGDRVRYINGADEDTDFDSEDSQEGEIIGDDGSALPFMFLADGETDRDMYEWAYPYELRLIEETKESKKDVSVYVPNVGDRVRILKGSFTGEEATVLYDDGSGWASVKVRFDNGTEFFKWADWLELVTPTAKTWTPKFEKDDFVVIGENDDYAPEGVAVIISVEENLNDNLPYEYSLFKNDGSVDRDDVWYAGESFITGYDPEIKVGDTVLIIGGIFKDKRGEVILDDGTGLAPLKVRMTDGNTIFKYARNLFKLNSAEAEVSPYEQVMYVAQKQVRRVWENIGDATEDRQQAEMTALSFIHDNSGAQVRVAKLAWTQTVVDSVEMSRKGLTAS